MKCSAAAAAQQENTFTMKYQEFEAEKFPPNFPVMLTLRSASLYINGFRGARNNIVQVLRNTFAQNAEDNAPLRSCRPAKAEPTKHNGEIIMRLAFLSFICTNKFACAAQLQSIWRQQCGGTITADTFRVFRLASLTSAAT